MSRPPKSTSTRVRAEDALTARELEVLALAASGELTSAISRRLGIAQDAVKTHLTNVYRKTGARNRVQATRDYLDHYEDVKARR